MANRKQNNKDNNIVKKYLFIILAIISFSMVLSGVTFAVSTRSIQNNNPEMIEIVGDDPVEVPITDIVIWEVPRTMEAMEDIGLQAGRCQRHHFRE